MPIPRILVVDDDPDMRQNGSIALPAVNEAEVCTHIEGGASIWFCWTSC